MAIPIDSFANRFNQLLRIKNMTKAELSRLSGIDKSSLTHYSKGDWKAKQDALFAIAEATGVSESWLSGYDVPMEREEEETEVPEGFDPLPDTITVPLIGDIACGAPILAEENVEDYIQAPKEKHPDFALRCHGDSMIDAGIYDEDIVYIKKCDVVDNGQIAAVRIGDEATLKYVQWDGKTLTLIPANRKMFPRSYTGEQLNEIKIEGLAVGFTHWF